MALIDIKIFLSEFIPKDEKATPSKFNSLDKVLDTISRIYDLDNEAILEIFDAEGYITIGDSNDSIHLNINSDRAEEASFLSRIPRKNLLLTPQRRADITAVKSRYWYLTRNK